MILDAARLSLANLFAPQTRGVFWKVLGLTLLALVVVWFGLRESFIAFAWPWLQAAVMPDLPDWAGWLTFVFGIVANVVAVLAGLVIATAGFFGAHAIASGWTGRMAPAGKAQASSLYNLFYYGGSSVVGWFGGLAFDAGYRAGGARTRGQFRQQCQSGAVDGSDVGQDEALHACQLRRGLHPQRRGRGAVQRAGEHQRVAVPPDVGVTCRWHCH